jgi:hypothetical protein
MKRTPQSIFPSNCIVEFFGSVGKSIGAKLFVLASIWCAWSRYSIQCVISFVFFLVYGDLGDSSAVVGFDLYRKQVPLLVGFKSCGWGVSKHLTMLT